VLHRVEGEVAPIPLKNPQLFGKSASLPVRPRNFLENPSLAQVRGNNCVFMFLLTGDEFVEEAEEFVNLRFRKICVVCGVLDFEGVYLGIFAGDDVGERAETRVTDWNPHRVAAVPLKELDEDTLAVETPFAPTPEGNLVDFPNHE
jgi:hypothetical protein